MSRVLIVEDEPSIALVLQEVMRDEGYEVTTLSSGTAALHWLGHAAAPHVAFIDLHLPGAPGHRVIDAIRAHYAWDDVAVVLLTGAAEDPEALPPPGTYQALVAKPFDLSAVLRVTRRLAT